MAMSDVYGLARFREYMEGLEDCYAVIGGTACDILLREADMRFRATKDIDVILVVEGRLPEVGRAVWRMVADGGYTCGWKSSDRARFYRFTEPSEPGFPSMIELFSTSPDFIPEPSALTIVPLPVDDEVSSLSAILLDPDYYAFMKAGCVSSSASLVFHHPFLSAVITKVFRVSSRACPAAASASGRGGRLLAFEQL